MSKIIILTDFDIKKKKKQKFIIDNIKAFFIIQLYYTRKKFSHLRNSKILEID